MVRLTVPGDVADSADQSGVQGLAGGIHRCLEGCCRDGGVGGGL